VFLCLLLLQYDDRSGLNHRHDIVNSGAPASTATTAPAATTAKKPASLKAVTGFGKLDPNTLVNTAHHIAKGIGGNPTYFPNPPVDPAALDASATTLSTRSSPQWMRKDCESSGQEATQAGRSRSEPACGVCPERVQRRSGDLRGEWFTAKPTGKSAPQPVAVPSFRSLDYGANSGQIAVSVKKVSGAKSYFIRYAVMNGTTPGS